MSTLTAQTYLTPEEYLAWERKQPFKNEYHNGQIIAMSGASRWHNRIWTCNTFGHLEDMLSLASIKGTLPLRAIYRRVMFNAS